MKHTWLVLIFGFSLATAKAAPQSPNFFIDANVAAGPAMGATIKGRVTLNGVSYWADGLTGPNGHALMAFKLPIASYPVQASFHVQGEVFNFTRYFRGSTIGNMTVAAPNATQTVLLILR